MTEVVVWVALVIVFVCAVLLGMFSPEVERACGRGVRGLRRR
jgi:hypothetical protein